MLFAFGKLASAASNAEDKLSFEKIYTYMGARFCGKYTSYPNYIGYITA